MSSAVFPKFPGASFSTFKRPTGGSTIVQTTASGKEVRIAQWPLGSFVWDFTLTFNHLRGAEPYQYIGQVPSPAALIGGANLIANDMKALAGFFLARQGKFDSWLFDDVTDDWIDQAQIGVGDSSTLTWQIARQLGEVTEDIQNLNGTAIAAPDWAPNTAYQVGALVMPTAARIRTGGLVASGWQSTGWPVYFKCAVAGTSGNVEPQWLNAAVAGQSITDGGATWTCQGVPTAVYLETALAAWVASHSYAVGAVIQPTSGNAGGFIYICTTAGTSGAAAPTWPQAVGNTVADGTGTVWTNYGVPALGVLNPIVPQLPSTWSINSIGQLTFASAPPLNAQIFVTSGFYFRCRFKQDISEFEQFMGNIWKLGKLDFISLKL